MSKFPDCKFTINNNNNKNKFLNKYSSLCDSYLFGSLKGKKKEKVLTSKNNEREWLESLNRLGLKLRLSLMIICLYFYSSLGHNRQKIHAG